QLGEPADRRSADRETRPPAGAFRPEGASTSSSEVETSPRATLRLRAGAPNRDTGGLIRRRGIPPAPSPAPRGTLARTPAPRPRRRAPGDIDRFDKASAPDCRTLAAPPISSGRDENRAGTRSGPNAGGWAAPAPRCGGTTSAGRGPSRGSPP